MLMFSQIYLLLVGCNINKLEYKYINGFISNINRTSCNINKLEYKFGGIRCYEYAILL